MRCLLDTHAFLWWIVGDSRLSPTAAAIIRDANNEVLFSAASAWEIGIKTRLGRITFEDDPRAFIPRQLAANRFRELPVSVEHALRVTLLPDLHRDPFDRLLVAQAQAEGLSLLTADSAVAQYDVAIIW